MTMNPTIQTPNPPSNRPPRKEKTPAFMTVIKTEEWWVQQARKNIAYYMTYISDWQRQPAKHHLEWLKTILDPSKKRILIIAPRESAKAQTLNSLLATPYGWRRMGDVRIGDWVFGQDGCPVQIIGVYPQGKKSTYRIIFTDGSSVECTDDHLWNVRLVGAKDNNKWRTLDLNTIRTQRWNNKEKRYTKSSLEKPWLDHRGHARYHIPICDPVQYPNIDLPLQPYLLGALLGDGGLGNGTVMFTSEDDDVLDRVFNELPESVIVKQRTDYDYALVTERGQINPLIEALKQLGLHGTLSHTKFIPHLYLRSAFEDRIALLQGLMDTDGSLSRNKSGVRPTFCTVSEQLAKDVIELVNSLGGTSTCVKKHNSYVYKGERREARDYYLLHIKVPEGVNPFYLRRKAQDYKPCPIYKPTRGIIDIEYVGEEDSQCIRVANENGLYLTDNYIVTHNTSLAVDVMSYWIGRFPNTTNGIFSVSVEQAKDRLDSLKQIIELPRYHNVFPHIHPDMNRPYNKSEFSVWSEQWPGSDKIIGYQAYRSLIASYGSMKNPTVFSSGMSASGIIGRRFSGIALVDDPHDSKNSATLEQCLKVEKFFNENILGAMQETGKVVVITTRWAELDLAGRLAMLRKSTGEPVWTVIDIPAIDKTTGASYWPEYWTLERLQEKREEVGEIMFQTMYMNNPLGASTGMFQPQHLIHDIPHGVEFEKVVLSCDLAKTKTASSDYTVIFVVAKDNKKPFNYYILDGIRVKWDDVDWHRGIDTIANLANATAEKYGKLNGVVFEEPFDVDKANELRERYPSLPVITVKPKGDKSQRLGNVAIKAQSGHLFINQEMECLPALRSEFLGFPKAAHDDTCDAASLALQLDMWATNYQSGLKEIRSPYLVF